MTKWEYTSIPIAAMQVQQLNEMGQLGWELVTVVSVPTRNDLDFVFKRPILENPYGAFRNREEYEAYKKKGLDDKPRTFMENPADTRKFIPPKR